MPAIWDAMSPDQQEDLIHYAEKQAEKLDAAA
jgi:hypothetical protein